MYERFFGLKEPPFRLTPDPRFLFLSRKHADALAHLRLVLAESGGFVCITGDVGTGKTTLVRAFLAGLQADVTTAYVFNPNLSPLELLQTINAEFGLPARSSSRTQLLAALNKYLLAQRGAGRHAMVVIDEAQALGLEVLEQLRLLSNLETETEKLLRVVLVGQPQLRTLLLHPDLVQLNQRITLRWHIGPLTHSETTAYVRHRLEVAGAEHPANVFTRGALVLLHRLAGGVPRLVNMIAHRSLLVAFVAGRRRVTRRTVRQAYGEIVSIPLPGARPVRRAAWAALGIGVCLGVITIAARELGQSREPRPARTREMTAASLPPGPSAGTASATTALTAEAPEPAFPSRLAALDGAASARTALAAALARWQARPLAPTEPAGVDEFTSAARRRGLEHVALTANAGMLRLLDLPAVLEVQLPGSDGPRYLALVGLEPGRARLVADGFEEAVPAAAVERYWFGRAHVLWRDFEDLGAAALAPDARGEPVRKLQRLLRRAGVLAAPETGQYADETTAAVRDFQRSRYLDADARVGPLTRIMLYAAAGGYARPTLAPPQGNAS